MSRVSFTTKDGKKISFTTKDKKKKSKTSKAKPSKSTGKGKGKGKGKAMAKGKKKKGNGGNRRLGLAAWFSQWMQIILTFANPVARTVQSLNQPDGEKFSFFLRSLTKDYTGVRLDSNYQYIDWDWRNMIRGYAGPAVGYIQRKVVSASTKGMRVSLIPKLR